MGRPGTRAPSRLSAVFPDRPRGVTSARGGGLSGSQLLRRRGGRRSRLGLHEVFRLLVAVRVEVAAYLVDGVPAFGHGIGVGVRVAAGLAREDAAEGLSARVDERKGEVGLDEAVRREIARLLGGDLVASEAVQVADELADLFALRAFGPIDLPELRRR